ncbi:MAG: SH3 domain-containing protein [Elainella sp. Prado103]|jgi:hypothetical protein|nr:SH3 domain-containing protein [Elainella sp. Prado103]
MKTIAAFLLATLPLVGLGATLAVQPVQAQSDPMQIAYAEYATLVSQDGNSPINVRDGASTRSYARHIGYGGDRVEVLDRTVGDDGYMWYFVRFTVSNATGWVRGDFVWLDSE